MRKFATYFLVTLLALVVGLLSVQLVSKVPSTSISSDHVVTQRFVLSNSIDPLWVYLNEDVTFRPRRDWRSQADLGYSESNNARVLVFFPDGEYASLNCHLLRLDSYPRMVMIPGQQCSVYKGHWKRSGNKLVTSSTYRELNRLFGAEIPPGVAPFRTEQFLLREYCEGDNEGEIQLDGTGFIPGQKIDGIFQVLAQADNID